MRPQDLELEITEGVLIDDDHATSVALYNLRANGVRIALDDFGTGYSSLNYLKRYPVDCIKIDRSFVSQLSPGSVSVAIVQAMITLAHAMNIEVTAEGVETQEQMTMLAEMGCNTFQGFLLSTPVTPLMIEGMFRQLGEPRAIAAPPHAAGRRRLGRGERLAQAHLALPEAALARSPSTRSRRAGRHRTA